MDTDELKKRAGILNEDEAARRDLEHQFWHLVDVYMDNTDPKEGYHFAATELLKMVPSPLLSRYIKQQSDVEEGY